MFVEDDRFVVVFRFFHRQRTMTIIKKTINTKKHPTTPIPMIIAVESRFVKSWTTNRIIFEVSNGEKTFLMDVSNVYLLSFQSLAHMLLDVFSNRSTISDKRSPFLSSNKHDCSQLANIAQSTDKYFHLMIGEFVNTIDYYSTWSNAHRQVDNRTEDICLCCCTRQRVIAEDLV